MTKAETMADAKTGAPLLGRLASHFEVPDVRERVGEAGERLFDAVDEFWSTVYSAPYLSPRMKELVMLAFHASSSALNADALRRHVVRALYAGATKIDVLDVLVTILPLANHPLYVGIPVLMDELDKAGLEEATVMPPMREDILAIKRDFVESRGYWTPMRDKIGQLLPDYFGAFINACLEPWRSGSLTAAERELIYIAIDTSITHSYESGLRMHIRNALRYGATKEQILEVFQLAALLGTEGYILGLNGLISCTLICRGPECKG
jgi:alkylhydroperoxidase/carboxymuconolactone decarboxylase family protein YurZ